MGEMLREFWGSAFNVKEVALYLGISVATIYRLTQKGEIPAQKIGSQWRYVKQEIGRWMKESPKRQ